MRTNKKKIKIIQDKTGLPENVFALQMAPSRKSPFENYTRQEPNTKKRIVTDKIQFNSENQAIELNNDDFESGQNSTIMIRARARGRKVGKGLQEEKRGATRE